MKYLFLAFLVVGLTHVNSNAEIISYTYTAEITGVSNADTFSDGMFSDIQTGGEITGQFAYDSTTTLSGFDLWFCLGAPNGLSAAINSHSFCIKDRLVVDFRMEPLNDVPYTGFTVFATDFFCGYMGTYPFQEYLVLITFPLAEDGPTFSYDELPTDLYLFDWSNGEFYLKIGESSLTDDDLIVEGNITNLEIPIPSAFSFLIIGVAIVLGLGRNKPMGVS